MAQTKIKRRPARAHGIAATQSLDGMYLLKMVLYLIVGSFWLKMTVSGAHIPIPFGLLIGLLFVRQERIQIDRKIGCAVLLVAMLVGYFAPFGIYINV